MLIQPPFETYRTNKVTLVIVIAFALFNICVLYIAFSGGDVEGPLLLLGVVWISVFGLWIAGLTPFETYRTDKMTLGLVIAFALFNIWVLYIAFSGGSVERPLLFLSLVLIGVFGLWIAWLLSVRVSLHENGIAYHSLFGSKEMLWDEVYRFYYSSLKRSINLIPVGTYYSFKLQSSNGQWLSFGNRLEKLEQLGSRLIQLTYPMLFQKCARHFDSGVDVEFGSVRLSRSGGIQIKKLFRVVKIPLDSVAEYRIEEGSLYVSRVGQNGATSVSIRQIPNVFALVGLLDAIYKPPTGRSAQSREDHVMSNLSTPQAFKRLQTAGTVLFVLLCGVPSLEMNGFGLGIPFSLPAALACAAVGGAVGGMMMCPRPILAGLIGGLLAGPFGLVAVYYYTLHREQVWNLEIVIVQGIACLPGAGIGLLLKRVLLTPSSGDRHDTDSGGMG